MAGDKSTVKVTFLGDASQLERASRRAQASLSSVSKQTDASLGRSGKSFLTLGLAAKAGLAGVGFAVGKVSSDSVALEVQFSQTMNTMAAVAKVPAADMKRLSDLAMKMGADTVFSASEAADAMLELAKGGLSAATIEGGALAGTLTLAAAGGTDLATAATISSNALNAFSLAGSDVAAVAAALAGGANASSTSVESLGMALGQVGLGAVNAGLSLQETVAVLAAFDSAGLKGVDGGTSLKTMLARLVPATDKAKAAMRDLGLEFTDAKGQFLPIADIAGQLQAKMSGLSQAQRTAALNTIFSSDATRAASVLMKLGSKGVQDYTKATSDQNAAQDVAAARMKGTAGAIEAMKGSLETAKLAMGQAMAPAVTAGAKGLASAFNAIGKAIPVLVEKGKQLRAQYGPALAPVFAALGAVFVKVAGWVRSDLIPVLMRIGKFLVSTLGPAFGKIAGIIREQVLPMWRGLAVRIKENIAPILGVIGVVVKLGAIFLPIFLRVATFFGRVFLAALGLVIGIIGRLARVFLAMVGVVVNGAAKAFGWVPGLGGKLKSAATNFNAFRDDVNASLDGIRDKTINVTLATGGAGKVVQGRGGKMLVDGGTLPAAKKGPKPKPKPGGGGYSSGASYTSGGGGSGGGGAKKAAEKTVKVYRGVFDGISTLVRSTKAITLSSAKGIAERAAAIAKKALAPLDRAIEASKSRLAALRQQSDELRRMAVDNAKSFASVLGYKAEEGKETTTGDVLASMRERLAKVRKFAADMKTLAAQGLNKGTFAEIMAAGVDGGSAVAAALTQGGVSEVNSLQAQVNAASAGLGANADYVFGDRIKAEAANLKSLTQIRQVASKIEINVKGSVITERDLARTVRDELVQLIRRRGGNPAALGI